MITSKAQFILLSQAFLVLKWKKNFLRVLTVVTTCCVCFPLKLFYLNANALQFNFLHEGGGEEFLGEEGRGKEGGGRGIKEGKGEWTESWEGNNLDARYYKKFTKLGARIHKNKLKSLAVKSWAKPDTYMHTGSFAGLLVEASASLQVNSFLFLS